MDREYNIDLEIGIGYISFTVTSKDSDGKEKLEDFGIRMFDSGETNDYKRLKNQDRRMFRNVRRVLRRKVHRKERVKNYLQKIVRFLVKDWSAKRKKAKADSHTTRSGINTTEWFSKVPDTVRPTLTSVIEKIADKPELDDEDFSNVVREVYDLIPPYT